MVSHDNHASLYTAVYWIGDTVNCRNARSQISGRHCRVMSCGDPGLSAGSRMSSCSIAPLRCAAMTSCANDRAAAFRISFLTVRIYGLSRGCSWAVIPGGTNVSRDEFLAMHSVRYDLADLLQCGHGDPMALAVGVGTPVWGRCVRMNTSESMSTVSAVSSRLKTRSGGTSWVHSNQTIFLNSARSSRSSTSSGTTRTLADCASRYHMPNSCKNL